MPRISTITAPSGAPAAPYTGSNSDPRNWLGQAITAAAQIIENIGSATAAASTATAAADDAEAAAAAAAADQTASTAAAAAAENSATAASASATTASGHASAAASSATAASASATNASAAATAAAGSAAAVADNAAAVATAKTAIDGYMPAVQSASGGNRPFATLADLNAYAGGDKSTFVANVMSDGTTANNGLYRWTGSAWVKSGYDPATLATTAKTEAIAAAATDATSKANGAINSALAADAALEHSAINANIFSAAEIVGADFSRLSLTASRSITTAVATGIQIANPASATNEVRWRFSSGHFKKTNTISGSVRVLALDASAGAAVNAVKLILWQTNASGGTIASTSITIAGAGAVSTATTYLINAVALDPAAVFVEIGVSVQGVAARNLVIADLCINAGESGAFTRPAFVQANRFVDGGFTGEYTSINQKNAVSSVSGEQVLTFESIASLRYINYQLPATEYLAPGAVVRWGAESFAGVAAGTSITMIFYDAAGAEISRVAQSSRIVNAWDVIAAESAVPATAARVDLRLSKEATTTTGQFKGVFLNSSLQNRRDRPAAPAVKSILHVDAMNGDDSNAGSRIAPLKTLSRAMLLASADTRIIVAEGDYFEAPQLTQKIINLEIEAQPGSRVRLIGGTKISGATQTAGYAKIWQVAMAAAPAGKHLYQWGTPDADTLIAAADRHKYHEGRTHRLPDFTRLWNVASVAAIESATRPSWYWSGGTLYFSVVGGGSPTGIDIYIPDSVTSPFYGAGLVRNQSLRLVGIEAWHWLHGFRTWDMARVVLERCRAFGNASNGFEYSDSLFVQRIGCESGGNGNDGAGAHVYRANTYKMSCRYVGTDNYEHDNYDDGESMHEMWTGHTVGGVVEFNGDRGVATAVGCHTTHIGTLAIKNGQGSQTFGYSIDDGAGFGAVGSAVDGGVSTDMILVACVADSNVVNFNCVGGAANTIRATDCKSLNAVTTHYNCGAGTITLTDCGSSGAGTVKATSGSGVITVRNTALVE